MKIIIKQFIFLCCVFICLTINAQTIQQIEYFIDNDPGFGNGTPVSNSGGSDVTANFNVPLGTIDNGVHTLYVRAQDSDGNWSLLQSRTFIKGVANASSGNLPNIVSVEYFIDNDEGFGEGTEVLNQSGSDVTVPFSVDLSDEPNGVHTLYVRAQDSNGNWSLLQSRTFIKGVATGVAGGNPNIERVEYFIDEDPGFGLATTAPFISNPNLTNVLSEFVVDLSDEPNGVHTLYVRAKDDNDNWSLLQSRTFIKGVATGGGGNKPDIEYIEYFIDEDLGFGNGTSVPFDAPNTKDVTVDFTASLSTLNNGVHTIYVRARDSNDNWSLLQSRTFIKMSGVTSNGELPDIVNIEFQIPDIPAYANWNTVTGYVPSSDVCTDFIVADVCNLPVGTYTIFARAQDENGIWSLTASQEFEVADFYTVSGTVIDQNGNPLSGVNVSFDNFDVGTLDVAITNGSGEFSVQVPTCWKGEINLTHPNYLFDNPAEDYNSTGIVGDLELILTGTDTDLPPAYLVFAGMRVYADVIPQTGFVRTLSGNVYITKDEAGALPVLMFSEPLTVDLLDIKISGSGEIYVEDIGSQEINIPIRIAGNFEYWSTPGSTTLHLDQSFLGLVFEQMAFVATGLPFSAGTYKVLKNGLEIKGEMELPEVFAAIKPDWATQDDKYKKLKIEFENLQLIKNEGLGIKFDGELKYKDKAKLAKIIHLKEVCLEYDAGEDKFVGLVAVSSNLFNSFTLELTTTIKDFELKNAGFSIEVPYATGIPICTTPLRITKGALNFGHCKYDPVFGDFASQLGINTKTKGLSGTMSIVPPPVPWIEYQNGNKVYLFSFVDSGVKISNDLLAINGKLNLFKQPALKAYGSINFKRGLYFGTELDLLTMIKGRQEYSLYLGEMTAKNDLGLYMPGPTLLKKVKWRFVRKYLESLFFPGQRIGDIRVFARLSFYESSQTAYVAGSYFRKGLPRIYAYAGYDGQEWDIDWSKKYKIVPHVDAQEFLGGKAAPGEDGWMTELQNKINLKSSSNPIFRAVLVTDASEGLFVDAVNPIEQPDFTLTLPSGQEINPINHEDFEHIHYYENVNENYGAYYVENPDLGVYIFNLNNVIEDSLEVRGANTAPCIDISSVVDNGNGTTTISWFDSDPDDNANINIGLDTDRQGGSAIYIAQNISEDATVNSITWNHSEFPTGIYYVFAEIEDTSNVAFINYHEIPLVLEQNGAPNAPTGLTYTLTDSSVVFNWNKNNDSPYIDYLLYYSNEVETLNYESNILNYGDTNAIESLDLDPGLYYEFMVTAVDTAGRESGPSNTISFDFTSVSINNSPYINDLQEYQTVAYIDETYNYQLETIDEDGDALDFDISLGPIGMTISDGGVLSWTPTDADIGINSVYITVGDGNGGLDSTFYQINVLDPILSEAYLEFSKGIYNQDDAMGMISVFDRDCPGSLNAIDNVQVTLYSNSDPTGITLTAIESEPASKEFNVCFGLSQTTSTATDLLVALGDTIWAEFMEPNPAQTVTSIAHYEFIEQVECQQSIPLNPGWNLISLDVSPDIKTISNIFGGLQAGNLEFVTGFDNGAKVFNPNDPPFLNTLSQVEDGFGYWVKVANADVLNVSGACLDNDFRKPFDAGWNLVAYPPDAPQAPSSYFADLISENNLEFVTGFENGALVFNPDDPPFLNTLTQMKNGFGYWLKVENAVAGKQEANINQSNVFSFFNGTSNLPEGSIVTIETSKGEVVGEMQVVQDGYLMTTAVYGEDAQTDKVEGLEIGEKLLFVYNGQKLDLGISFKGDLGVQKIDLSFEEEELVNETLEEGMSVKVYPNPAQSDITFEFQLPESGDLLLNIYNQNGQLVKTEKVANLESGAYRFNYPIDQLANGIYTYQLQSGVKEMNGKFEVLK